MSLASPRVGVFLSLCLLPLILLLMPDQTAHAGSSAALGVPLVTRSDQPDSSSANQPSTVTAADGTFRFDGLERATHQLYLEPSSLPAGLRPLPAAPRVALWINPGQSLVSGPVGKNVRLSAHYDDAGTTINGAVFFDRDGDGRRGAAEKGLAGVTVVDPAVHQYFVPFNDDDLWTLFAEINDDDPAIGQCLFDSTTSRNLVSVISVTSSSDGTLYYYDHWEDGYDPDPLLPGPTTVFGVLDIGLTRVFADSVMTPRTTDLLLFDGRDRITIFGERATVTRAVYPERPDERLAGAWEVPAVSDWGRGFIPVIGEDLDVNGAGTDDFDYVGLQIMAAEPDTEIWVNGALVTTTTAPGATILIDGDNDGPGGGGVDSTDLITATGPIQVQALGAACTAPFSARAYTLQPIDAWTNDYWAPVPDFTDGNWCNIDGDNVANDDRDTDIYVHNHHPHPITITFDDGFDAAIPLVVPAHTTISLMATLGRDLNAASGAHLYSDALFWGVSAIDSTSGNSANSASQHNDWGYSLIPVDRLSSQAVMGWSPGNSLLPPTSDPRHNSGNLAFVSAITDTVVYVDLFVDGGSGSSLVGSDVFDMNGDGDADDFDVFDNPNFDEPRSDDGITLRAGQVLRVADPNDNDLAGAVIYTRDLTHKIAVAWGQDPCRSEQGRPYLDLGYTVLATPNPSLSKGAGLALDSQLTGNVISGDVLTYTLILRNNGIGPMFNAVLTDTLPYTYTDFFVDSLAVTQPPPLGSQDYYNGDTGAWGYRPTATAAGTDPAVWALRLDWPKIEGGAIITATFRVLVDEDLPPEAQEICNRALFCSDETGCAASQVCTPIGLPSLQVDKVGLPNPVRPGDLLTYTVVVTNAGDGTAVGALVLDNLPPYVTYQPGTLNLTLPVVVPQMATRTVPFISSFSGSYADDFDLTPSQTTGYAGNDGSLRWSTNWIEIDDFLWPGPAGGDVHVGGATGASLSPPAYLELTDSDGLPSGAARSFDLDDFVAPRLRYYVSGVNTPGDAYQVRVNGVLLLSEQYAGPYRRRVLDLSAYAGAPVTVQLLAQAGLGTGAAYRFDNVFIRDASPLRSGIRTVTETIAVLTYTTQTGIDPVATKDRVMTVTNPIRIPAGAQARFSFQVRVDTPLPNRMELLNTVYVTSTNVLTAARDVERTIVLSDHTLDITKTGHPATVYIGQWITYTLFWEVNGDEPAPGLVVTDTLPRPYADFVRCAGGLGCTFIPPDTVVWHLGDRLPIASGVLHDSGWLTLTLRAERYPPGGFFTNTVVIDDATDAPPDQDDERTQVLNAGFALDKRRLLPATGPAHITDTVQFRITITNTGALTVTRLPLADTYDPIYLEYQGAVPPPDTNSPGRLAWNDLTADQAPEFLLPPGASLPLTVTFRAISSTQHLVPPVTLNTALSDGARTVAGDLPRIQDVAEVEIQEPPPGYALSKGRILPAFGPAQVGNDVQFRILITNTGQLDITRLPLADTYDPVYLEYRGAQPPPDHASPGLLAWDDLTANLAPHFVLAPGQQVSLTVTFRAISSTQYLSPPVTVNTALIDGARTAARRLPSLQDDADVEITVSTAIQLLYFRAGPRAGSILVEWATLLELDTYGFWLHRGRDADLNHALPLAFIPSRDQHGLGAFYTYLDTALPLGLYHYWLIEVENGGQRTTYGPVNAWPGWSEADLPYRLYLPLITRD
jgi:uncharacterized repeat protein (TIGR01451 family)